MEFGACSATGGMGSLTDTTPNSRAQSPVLRCQFSLYCAHYTTSQTKLQPMRIIAAGPPHTNLAQINNFPERRFIMKHRTLKLTAAAILTMSLLTLPVAAADMGSRSNPQAMQNFFAPRNDQGTPNDTGASDSMGTSDGNGSNIDGSQNGQGNMGNSGDMGNGGAGNGGSDSMLDTGSGEGNLGDTSGPTESGDGVIDGTADTGNSPMSDAVGDAAGATDEDGGSMLGIIITLLIIGAIVILIFALIPKKKS